MSVHTAATAPSTQTPQGPTRTIAARVRQRALDDPRSVALRFKDRGLWHEISWESYWQSARTVGHALIALGIEPGDRVAIHSENRPEWLFTDVGTTAVRAVTVGLYPTSPPAEVGYLLAHSEARILVAEDQEQVDKALAVLDQCPRLEWIVYLEPRGIRDRYDHPQLMSWDQFVARGAAHHGAHSDALDARMAAATASDLVTLV